MLTVRNLSFSVGEKLILREVNADFSEGKVTAIVGANGCGKSTLMSFLSKTRHVEKAVYFRGRDVATIPASEYALQVVSPSRFERQ